MLPGFDAKPMLSLARRVLVDLRAYLAAGAGAIPRSVQSKLRELFTTPQDFAAVANGTADDGAKVRTALSSFAATGGVLRFLRGTYVVGASGGSCLPISAPMNLVGDGGVYTAINPSSATATDDTVSIAPSAVDHTLAGISGLHLGNPSTGVRTGRYGVFADTQVAGRNLPKYTMRDMVIGQGSNAGFYHLNNVVNNANGGMYCALFQNNQFKGGIKLENSGDSISILHNILSGTGGLGVHAILATGASLLEIQSNNITTDQGAIKIASGSRFRILGNNIEHYAVGAVANNNSAVVNISGSTAVVYGGVIKENLMSGFSLTDATALLRIDNARGALVEDNVFLSSAAGLTTAITIGSLCQDIRIGANTYNAGITTKVSDNGVGTMGVVKTVTLLNSWVAYDVTHSPLEYIKSPGDGIVHLYGSIKSGTVTNGTVLGILPAGFRPLKTIRAHGFYVDTGVAKPCEINVDSGGNITINYVTSSGTNLNVNISFPAANLADATSLE